MVGAGKVRENSEEREEEGIREWRAEEMAMAAEARAPAAWALVWPGRAWRRRRRRFGGG